MRCCRAAVQKINPGIVEEWNKGMMEKDVTSYGLQVSFKTQNSQFKDG
jgi:hypothetical protein